MEKTVLPKASQLQHETLKKLRQADSLCIALGMGAEDPTYPALMETIETMGKAVVLGEGLFRLDTGHSIDNVFARINERLIDPRMDSGVGLVVIDPQGGRAKWYLSLEASALLNRCWRHRNNLFISGAVYSVQELGPATHIGASLWYVSSRFTPAQAQEILSEKSDSPVTIIDAVGYVASSNPRSRSAERSPAARPWQEVALAEFLHA